MKPRIREVIVVEGRYDKNALSQVVDAVIFETGGFSVLNNAEKVAFLRRMATERGLILLTDSDGAGFVIRNHLKGKLPAAALKQAYIPDVYGKERRKRAPGKERKIGVEGMPPSVLLDALRASGATFEDEVSNPAGEKRRAITKADMMDAGLLGANSSKRRASLLQALSLPEHLSSSALLDVLNTIMSREEFLEKWSEGRS